MKYKNIELYQFWIKKEVESKLEKNEVAKILQIHPKRINDYYRSLKPEVLKKLCDLYFIELVELETLHPKMITTKPKTIKQYFDKLAFDNGMRKTDICNIATPSLSLTIKNAKILYDHLNHIDPDEMSQFLNIPLRKVPKTNAEYFANYLFEQELTFHKYKIIYKMTTLKDIQALNYLENLETLSEQKKEQLKIHIEAGKSLKFGIKGNPSKHIA